MTDRRKPTTKRCDLCGVLDARRKDIPTNCFRGDDVVLQLCKEHRKDQYNAEALKLPKAIKQMEQT